MVRRGPAHGFPHPCDRRRAAAVGDRPAPHRGGARPPGWPPPGRRDGPAGAMDARAASGSAGPVIGDTRPRHIPATRTPHDGRVTDTVHAPEAETVALPLAGYTVAVT